MGRFLNSRSEVMVLRISSLMNQCQRIMQKVATSYYNNFFAIDNSTFCRVVGPP